MMTLAVNFAPLTDARAMDLDDRINQSVGEAIGRGLDDIADEARANVAELRNADLPASSPLMASIGTGMAEDGLSGAVHAGGNIAPYAVFVEFGALRSPAQPFLSPALAAHERRVRDDIAAALESALGERA